MKKLKDRLFKWFFQIENEVLIPFLVVGIVVICGFGVISYYNGYTMQRDNQKNLALSMFEDVNRDLDYLDGKLSGDELKDKYRYYGRGSVRITGADGEQITYETEEQKRKKVFLTDNKENKLGWKLEFLIDESAFEGDLLEKQNYMIIGAIAALIIIIQASIFISYNITKPIRDMSRTCREINENKHNYRNYRFDSVKRRDEIGQLAVTFETLLRNMDNYTKMEYTSKMSAALAHEIKNPIAGIRSGIQLLMGRTQKEGDKMLCDSMIREIDRVTALIMNLFTLSVKKESSKSAVSLERVVRDISVIYGKGMGDKKFLIETAVEEGLTGYLNENEFRQIVHNLLSNSIKALPAAGGLITIRGMAEKETVRLIFEDNGKGMSKEEVQQAVEPFYTKSVNGIGLGLAVVNKLVEQNDGTMKIDSISGEGTRVELTFRRKEAKG